MSHQTHVINPVGNNVGMQGLSTMLWQLLVQQNRLFLSGKSWYVCMHVWDGLNLKLNLTSTGIVELCVWFASLDQPNRCFKEGANQPNSNKK